MGGSSLNAFKCFSSLLRRLRRRAKKEKKGFAGITCPPDRVPRTPAGGLAALLHLPLKTAKIKT